MTTPDFTRTAAAMVAENDARVPEQRVGDDCAVTLTEFLLARIAEDEADASAASPGPWHVNAESDTVLAVDDIEVCEGFALSGPQLRATTAHVAHHDPARVLAECEAKRRIVSAVERQREATPHANVADEVLMLLAQAYADHPDYQDVWRIA